MGGARTVCVERLPHCIQLVTLLGLPGWFDAADSLNRWDVWLGDPQRAEDAFRQLARASTERPARVAKLVRPHIAESEDWRRRVCWMLSWSLSSELVDLAVELVELGEFDDVQDPDTVNSDFWMILHLLEHDDPAGAARLTGAFLRRGLLRAQMDGAEDPFESGHLSSHSQSASVIGDAAAKAAAEFVDHVLPFVIDVAMADQRQRDGYLPVGGRWAYRWVSSNHTVDNAVFNAADDALQRLARENPAKCAAALLQLRHAESSELRFLACRALTSIGDPDEAIAWITSDTRNLVLGWADSPCWASRELIKESSPCCSSDLYQRLEFAILDYRPSLGDNGYRHYIHYELLSYHQYELLSALDTARMSRPARRRLQELQRRFPDSPQGPQPVVAQFVESPIDEGASIHMSDDHWIGALNKHNRDEPTWNEHGAVGGALQLAGVLGRRAKDDPERFSRLALRFSKEIPAAAMNEIIRNVEGSVCMEVFTDLCEHAQSLYGAAVGQAVCSAIAGAGSANSRLVALLSAYAYDSDPSHEIARTETQNGEYGFGGDLLTAGLNATRGQAALAIGSVLFSGADHVDALLPVVEDLAKDDILAVRVCAAEAVLALFNHVPEQALDLAECLFQAPIDVLDARQGERLLSYAVVRDPDRFGRTLEEALVGPDEVATRAGRIWALARWRRQLPPSSVTDVRSLPTAARRGAAQAFASNVADSLDDLLHVLDDDDPEIRGQVALALLRLGEVAAPDLGALIDALVSSAAFPKQVGNLIHAFERMPSLLPAGAITVCERAVDIANTEVGEAGSEPMTSSALTGRGFITVVLRLYRQGDNHARGRCLDIIDRLAEFSMSDVEHALIDDR